MKYVKSLLVVVALGMAGFAAWLLYEAVILSWRGGEEQLADLPQPAPDLTYEQVLTLQLDALKDNDEFDSGIATAFNFASPRNRMNYKPNRDSDEEEMRHNFAVMLHGPHFNFLLNHHSSELGPEFATDDEARRLVTIVSREGEEIHMLFVLRRQTEPPYAGCWMTEGVEIMSRRPPARRNEPVVEA